MSGARSARPAITAAPVLPAISASRAVPRSKRSLVMAVSFQISKSQIAIGAASKNVLLRKTAFHLWKGMDWDDLRYFCAVARTGGLSGGARSLGVSAQTVGRRIAALEASIGAPLFVRHSGGYRLTADGQSMLGDAERVEEAMARLRANATARTVEAAGTVRLRSEEHTSELQPLMRTSYAVFCL